MHESNRIAAAHRRDQPRVAHLAARLVVGEKHQVAGGYFSQAHFAAHFGLLIRRPGDFHACRLKRRAQQARTVHARPAGAAVPVRRADVGTRHLHDFGSAAGDFAFGIYRWGRGFFAGGGLFFVKIEILFAAVGGGFAATLFFVGDNGEPLAAGRKQENEGEEKCEAAKTGLRGR